MATVFILQDKTWIERGHGLVRFVFDLRTFALRLVIRPGTPEEFECKLRPRIRSKGPRAYVVRAQAENGTDEHILAVRFEREEDSRSFRRFVEKRDVDQHPKGTIPSSQNPNAANYGAQQRDYNSSGVQQSPYHRQQNRGSNVAQSGYYPPNAVNPNMHHSPYGAANMMHSNPYNNVSPPVVQKSNHVQPNYFWTCSRCLQMVDPSLHTCHVCGTPRQPNGNGAPHPGAQGGGAPLQAISTNNAMQYPQPYPSGGGGGGGGGYVGNTGSPPMHRLPPQGTWQNTRPHGPSVTSKTTHHQPQVLKLTTINLEKHNKLFPPKRRNVKEIVITQIDWLRKHGQRL